MFRLMLHLAAAAALLTLAGIAMPAYAGDVYFQDFEDPADPLAEWSTSQTDVTPIGARRFLGQLGSQTATLGLANLPPHTELVVAFELFVIRSWDGNGNQSNPPGYGSPDRWRLAADGSTVYESTFKMGTAGDQCHPAQVTAADVYPGQTGVSEEDTLGYTHMGSVQDCVYRLVFCFEHDDDGVAIDFQGLDLQGLADESWGIDNVRVMIPDYCNRFEDPNDPLLGWANAAVDTTPVGARTYLGQYGNGGNTLTLGGLPAHTGLRIYLDLFVIRSWDGNGAPCCPGPDVWQLRVDGLPVVDTTFANGVTTPEQSYPGPYPSVNPPRTGAVENDTLGYMHSGGDRDSVYHLELVVPHSNGSVVIDLEGIGLQGLADESWGIDNLVVSTTDLPSQTFVRGDGDGDGTFNGLVDGIFILTFQFSGGSTPPCMEAADGDGDGAFNGLVDGIFVLNHQFSGGAAPPAPYPSCGVDPDPATSLGCVASGCP